MTEIIKLGLSVKTAKIGPTTLGGAGGMASHFFCVAKKKQRKNKGRKKEFQSRNY